MPKTPKFTKSMLATLRAPKGGSSVQSFSSGELKGWSLLTVSVLKDTKNPYHHYAFRQEDQLGKSKFGVVYSAYQVNPKTGFADFIKPWAIKKIVTDKLNAYENEQVKNEAAMLYKNRYKTAPLVSLEDGDKINHYIVTEYLKGADFFTGEYNTINRRIEKVSFDQRIDLIMQLTDQLNSFHHSRPDRKEAIVHRDIKGGNIRVLDNKGKLELRIIDFGVSEYTESTENAPTETDRYKGGTVYWPPEFFSGECKKIKKVGIKSDVYALTPIVAMLLGAKNPFSKKEEVLDGRPATRLTVEEAAKLTATNYTVDDMLTGLYPKKYPQDLKPLMVNFVNRMQARNYADRPSSKELLQFFTTLSHFCKAHQQSRKWFVSKPKKAVLAEQMVQSRIKLALLEKGINPEQNFHRLPEGLINSNRLEKILYGNHYPKEIKSFVLEFLKKAQEKAKIRGEKSEQLERMTEVQKQIQNIQSLSTIEPNEDNRKQLEETYQALWEEHKALGYAINGVTGDTELEVNSFFKALHKFCAAYDTGKNVLDREADVALRANGVNPDDVSNVRLKTIFTKLAGNGMLTQARALDLITGMQEEKKVILTQAGINLDWYLGELAKNHIELKYADQVLFGIQYPPEISSFVLTFLRKMQNERIAAAESSHFLMILKDLCVTYDEKQNILDILKHQVDLALMANGIALESCDPGLRKAMTRLAGNGLLMQNDSLLELIEKSKVREAMANKLAQGMVARALMARAKKEVTEEKQPIVMQESLSQEQSNLFEQEVTAIILNNRGKKAENQQLELKLPLEEIATNMITDNRANIKAFTRSYKNTVSPTLFGLGRSEFGKKILAGEITDFKEIESYAEKSQGAACRAIRRMAASAA